MINNIITGHCIGDAMGVPFEMVDRKFLIEVPVEGMERKKNSYSDDTAMTLATMYSIIKNKGINFEDMMHQYYLWITKGKFTQDKEAYGFGRTTYKAIYNYSLGVPALQCGINNMTSNGNGVLMRMMPLIIYLHKINADENTIKEMVRKFTIITHSHEINIIGTYIFARYCLFLMDGYTKEESYKMIQKLDYTSFNELALNKYKRILKSDISKLGKHLIKSGVAINETLEAVLWTILNTNSYQEALLTAINLGGDTDTIGAITGGVAGIMYDDIPDKWVNEVEGIRYIKKMISKFTKVIDKIKD